MTIRTINAENLARAMAARGFTQTALAEKLGVTRGAIGHWIAGRGAPLAPMLVTLSEALGVSVDYLTQKESAPALDLFGPDQDTRPALAAGGADTLAPVNLALYKYSSMPITAR